MTTELTMLAWTVVLGLVHLVASAQFMTAANGLGYGMSSRDVPPPKPLGTVGGRVYRAFKNLMQTFPFAAAAILMAAAAGRHNGYTVWGSELYFWARLAYVPIYAAGLAGVRTLVWLVSVGGIVLVLLGLVWG